MALFNQIQTACGALGFFNGENYLKDDDCEDALRILLRSLKFESEQKESRIQILESKIVESDLIPILINLPRKNNEKLFQNVLKLLVNLTKPAIVCFDGKIPREVFSINIFLKIEEILKKKKESFANEKLFRVLLDLARPVIDKEWIDRSDEDDFFLHAVFTLIRNVLSIRSDEKISQSNELSTHDLLLWSIHKSQIEDLIIYCGNKAQGDERILNLLEIVVLMLREQSPEALAKTGEKQTTTEREKSTETLNLLFERELAEKGKFQKLIYQRSAFGGATYVMSKRKGIGENQLICHRPLENLDSINFDREKQRLRRVRHRETIDEDDVSSETSSPIGIRLFLREFSLNFLENCFNILLPRAREIIIKSSCLLSDETNFFWAIRFFSEFNRYVHKSVDRISEALEISTFHLCHTKIDHYREMVRIDKVESKIWAKRLEIAFSTFKEYILCVKSMLESKDEVVIRAATIIKNRIFYVQEYRDEIYLLLRDFDKTKMSSSFLRNLVESTHEFLKMIEEHTKKFQHVFIQRSKKIRKAKSKKKNKKKEQKETTSNIEPPDQSWDEKILRLLSGEDNLKIDKSEVCPFDALSETPIDDQSLTALSRIQHALRTDQLDEAIALFRASRDVWQNEKSFGYENISSEDELKLLREIYVTSEIETLEIENSEKSDEEIDDENEEEEDRPQTIEREEQFDFQRFVARFAHSSILSSYIRLFKNYAKNSPFLNHCIIRMFYRICVDCQFVGILFQISLFRILQNFHRDSLAKSKQFSEIFQFSSWLLRKFFTTVQNNPCIFAELIFWKDRSIVDEILEIPRNSTIKTLNQTEKKKSTGWTIEEQIELRDLFRKLKDEQSETLGSEKLDLVDRILSDLTNKDRTRRQVIKELKIQGLIKSNKDLKLKKTKKNHRSKKFALGLDESVDENSISSEVEQSTDDQDESIENNKEKSIKSKRKRKDKVDNDDENNELDQQTNRESALAKTKKDRKLTIDDDDQIETNLKDLSVNTGNKPRRVNIDQRENKTNVKQSSIIKRKENRSMTIDDDDEDHVEANVQLLSNNKPKKKSQMTIDDDDDDRIQNESNEKIRTNPIDDDSTDETIENSRKNHRKFTIVVDDDSNEKIDQSSTTNNRKQSRKVDVDDDENDDDQNLTMNRPRKKVRRQIASSSEDEDKF